MAFKKGQPSANPTGKPKGTKNIASLEKRQLMNYLKEEGADRFLRILSEIDDELFMDKYLQLIEFAFPKQSRIDNNTTVTFKTLPPEKLTEIAKKNVKRFD